jgi:predicted dipeptidase
VNLRAPALLGLALTTACATTRVDPGAAADACALDAFRARALADASDEEVRGALRRWDPPRAVPSSDRRVIEALARRWLAACGRAEVVALTRALVAFPTVSAEGAPPEHPAFVAMARHLEAFADENDLEFSVYGPHDAWELTLGEGPNLLGFVMHADVVPVDAVETASGAPPRFSTRDAHPSDWRYPPFEARVDGDKLFGRGTEDDKGPIAAVLTAMRTLSRFGLTPRARVTAILGTGEEHDWDGMRRYVAAKRPPLFVVSIDAGYPVVAAEAGFVAWGLRLPRAPSDGVASSVGPKIVDVDGGEFLTQVPGHARMTVIPRAGEDAETLALQVRERASGPLEALGARFGVDMRVERDRVVVEAKGASIHTSEAEEGANALWVLARLAAALRPAPSAAATMLAVLDRGFVGDHYGERLGMGHTHPLMGKLLVAATMLKQREDHLELGVNMRRPLGKSRAEFQALLDAALEGLRRDVDPRLTPMPDGMIGDPAMADLEGPLVPTLLDLWHEATGERAAPISIRGGTYARLFRGAVSFGPSLPGKPYRGHASDEYIDLGALDLTTRLAMETILRFTAMTGDDDER